MKKIILICLAITCYTNTVFCMWPPVFLDPDHILHPKNISHKDLNTMSSLRAILNNRSLQRKDKDSRMKAALLQTRGPVTIKMLKGFPDFLHRLTRHNLIETIKLLVDEYSFDVNALWESRNGKVTPLWVAIDLYKPDIALSLLSSGANPHIRCDVDEPPTPQNSPQTAYEFVKVKLVKLAQKIPYCENFLQNLEANQQIRDFSSSEKFSLYRFIKGRRITVGEFSLNDLRKEKVNLRHRFNAYSKILQAMEKYKQH